MADLPYINAAQEVKITGQNSTGTTVNFVSADSNGNMAVKDYADGTPGSAVPSVALQVGGSDGTNLRALSTDTSGHLEVVGNVASGSSDSGNGIKVSGVYNTTVPSISNGQRSDIQTDSRGAIQVTLLDGSRQTYSIAVNGLTLATSPTDIFTLQGSASKTIRVLKIELNVSTTNGGAVYFDPALLRRSAANTGGTTVTDTATLFDTNNNAATATAVHYTANPTALGTSVGTGFRATREAAANGSGIVGDVNWEFGLLPGQAIVLRGTSQYIAINLGGTTIQGAVASFSVTWTEE